MPAYTISRYIATLRPTIIHSNAEPAISRVIRSFMNSSLSGVGRQVVPLWRCLGRTPAELRVFPRYPYAGEVG
ncbi:hypothetical protein [Kibdelosporangium philippinense]|uniref:hypothetical protein n=1 Tax=Kibdelosporangium philippinense TaxID=211113 RepID=UPI00362231DC